MVTALDVPVPDAFVQLATNVLAPAVNGWLVAVDRLVAWLTGVPPLRETLHVTPAGSEVIAVPLLWTPICTAWVASDVIAPFCGEVIATDGIPRSTRRVATPSPYGSVHRTSMSLTPTARATEFVAGFGRRHRHAGGQVGDLAGDVERIDVRNCAGLAVHRVREVERRVRRVDVASTVRRDYRRGDVDLRVAAAADRERGLNISTWTIAPRNERCGGERAAVLARVAVRACDVQDVRVQLRVAHTVTDTTSDSAEVQCNRGHRNVGDAGERRLNDQLAGRDAARVFLRCAVEADQADVDALRVTRDTRVDLRPSHGTGALSIR